MTRHPAVAEAAVVVRTALGKRELAAAFVATPEVAAPDDRTLKDWLAEWLPAHMIPVSFHRLDTLPLTANGKVDRSALATRAAQTADAAQGADLANAIGADKIMARLAHLWGEIADLRPGEPSAHFFTLGGDSLQATRLSLALRKIYGPSFTADAVFRYPTLAEQTSVARETGGGPLSETIPHRSTDGRGPISWAQHRLWLIEKLEPGGIAYNLPFLIRLRGRVSETALRAALAAVFDRHAILRSRFQETDDDVALVPVSPWSLALRVEPVDLDAVPALASEEAHAPFDLGGAGPSVRLRLLRHDEETWTLMSRRRTWAHCLYLTWRRYSWSRPSAPRTRTWN